MVTLKRDKSQLQTPRDLQFIVLWKNIDFFGEKKKLQEHSMLNNPTCAAAPLVNHSFVNIVVVIQNKIAISVE